MNGYLPIERENVLVWRNGTLGRVDRSGKGIEIDWLLTSDGRMLHLVES